MMTVRIGRSSINLDWPAAWAIASALVLGTVGATVAGYKSLDKLNKIVDGQSQMQKQLSYLVKQDSIRKRRDEKTDASMVYYTNSLNGIRDTMQRLAQVKKLVPYKQKYVYETVVNDKTVLTRANN